MSPASYQLIVIIWILLAVILFPLLIKVKAPYGRHSTGSWGPMIDNRTGWILMELPALVLFSALYLSGATGVSGITWIFFSLWVIHYVNRVFIFPLRTRTKGKKMPVLIMLLAMFFNLINAFINGYWLGYMAGSRGQGAYDAHWISDPRFIVGVTLFITGFIINQVADNHLIKLREKKGKGYFIPTHWLYRRVSCPNFGGELMEWTGFAVMTWSLPGLSFAIWTAANLIPRALHHHRWYKAKFVDYPKNRKAVIPGIL
jgi:hypothetical protein